MDYQQKIIDEKFAGDIGKFKNAFDQAVQDGIAETISWNELSLAVAILPELEEACLHLIEQRLGYLPPECYVIPFKPMLRGLIQTKQYGYLSEDEFLKQADEFIRKIRNADVQHQTCIRYDLSAFDDYYKSWPVYGYTVRSRLSYFLGYEPDLNCSVIAELWMRGIMSRDHFILPEHRNAIDNRAISLIKYREVLLREGKIVADASPPLMAKEKLNSSQRTF